MKMQSLYDPLAPLGKHRPWVWGLLALAVIGFQGPRYLVKLPGNLKEAQDFFQGWAAVKYFSDGISPYSHLRLAVETYLHLPTQDQEGEEIIYLYVQYNAHPPPSLFFAMPFGYFPYTQATLVWNLAGFVLYSFSLALIWNNLEMRFPLWGIFPLTVITLMGGPLISQVGLAQ